MRTATRLAAASAALALAAAAALAGCEVQDTGGGTGGPGTLPSGDPSGSASASPKDPVKELPDLVGMGLQSAQDAAQAAGFRDLTSHDSLGRGREQIWDRNWKVCFQSPASGRQSTGDEVDLGTVKLEEKCPAKDGKAPPDKAGGKMPDFTGKSVKVARQALDSSTSLTVRDASDDDRFVLLESNWQVCTQEPAAGGELDGQPVTLTAVKFTEDCP